MLILPAIDLRHGSCVRLYQGKADKETVYSAEPENVARMWESKGAKMLHIVDLDGAFEGRPVNLPLIGLMRQNIKIPIEVGGGFREMAPVEEAFQLGVDRVILGSVAIKNPEFVRTAIKQFGQRITVSIDVAGVFATTLGWTEVSEVTFKDLTAQMIDCGVKELLFTDTSRDGTLAGPDITLIRSFLEVAKLPVIISGGITSPDDILNLKKLEPLGVKGVVIGKALYDHVIELEDALRIAAS